MPDFVASIVLVGIYLLVEYMTGFLLYNLQRYSFNDQEFEFCYRAHSDAAVIMVTLYLGRGMILYWIFQGWPTFILKCALGIIAISGILFSTLLMYSGVFSNYCFGFDRQMDGKFAWIRYHFELSRIAIYWGLIQMGTAAMVFLLLPQFARRSFFRFHSTIGFFYFLLSFFTVMADISHFQYFLRKENPPKNYGEWFKMVTFYYTLLICAVLIAPHIESPIVR